MATKDPKHVFRPIGSALDEPDYLPRTVQKNPEQILAAIFLKLGRTYSGPLEATDALRLHYLLALPKETEPAVTEREEGAR